MRLRRGARVLDCAGDDIEKATAYHAWIPPMRSLAGTDPELLSTRLGLRPEHAAMVPLLGPLLGLKLGGNELIAAMTDEVRAANVRNLLLAALAHLGDTGPVVVTIEDAQWLDSSSWALLLAAARTIPTLLFVVTSRPFDDAAPAAAFRRVVGAAAVFSSSDDLRSLHALVAGGDLVGDEVVQLYINDEVSSVIRFVKELRGFERIHLEPGETKTVHFTLSPKELQMLDRDMKWVVEPDSYLKGSPAVTFASTLSGEIKAESSLAYALEEIPKYGTFAKSGSAARTSLSQCSTSVSEPLRFAGGAERALPTV